MSGKTGTGKTKFENWWLAHWYAARWVIVVIDIKRKWPTDPIVYAEKPELATLQHPYNITESGQLVEGCPVMVYHPSIPGWKDERLNRLFLAILARGNVVLALDEVRGVADQSHCPLGLTLIWTQGRQSAIPTIACFQKPVSIPTDLMEMAEWFAIFRQNNPDYRAKLVKMTGFPQIMQRPELYYYWLANENWDEPVLMAPVPLEASEANGAKALGAPGGGLQHTAPERGRQSGGQAALPSQGDGRSGVGKVANHPKPAHSHSRLHARSSR